jgi:hypothetical protein
MKPATKQEVLKELQKIPAIGKACSLDLYNLGMRKISDLKNQNPAVLYDQLNTLSGMKHDICMLYTFRCAVYYASKKNHDEKKLKWWYWKDKKFDNKYLDSINH